MKREIKNSDTHANKAIRTRRRCGPLSCRRGWILAGLVLALTAGPPSICAAQPPLKAECTQNDAFERLKCRHDSVAGQIEFMSSSVFAEGTRLGNKLTVGQRGQMKGVKMKSERSRGKSDAADFRKLAKSEAKANKKSCYMVPLAPADDMDNDGVCDYEQGNKNAQCAAIELNDQNEPQACNPKKKNKGKGIDGLECDLICDPETALTSDEEAEMLAEAAPMAEALDSLETDLYTMNEDLEDLNSTPAAVRASGAFSAAQNSCDTPTTTPGLDIATGILRQVSVTARGLAGMSGTGCDQTAVALGFGGNGSVVCLVFETAASVLEVAYTTTDEILKSEESAVQASTLSCLQQMQGDVEAGFNNLYNQHAAIMANDNANTDKIQSQIEGLRMELLQVLSTPQGQRENFPVK